jgi:hypothetical protein
VAEHGPFFFVAATPLNLLEVSPRPSHLALICAAAKHWLVAHSDSRDFRIGHAFGKRGFA